MSTTHITNSSKFNKQGQLRGHINYRCSSKSTVLDLLLIIKVGLLVSITSKEVESVAGVCLTLRVANQSITQQLPDTTLRVQILTQQIPPRDLISVGN